MVEGDDVGAAGSHAGTSKGLWRNRGFVCLFLAQVISLLGSGATTIGLALFAYQMTGAISATAVVGNALTLRILAFLLFSQPAGVLADRTNRKSMLVMADLARAALLGSLPFVTDIWQIYALIFSINAVTAFFTPTYEASVPSIVGSSRVVEALSFSRVAVDVEAIAAPAAAGVIVAVFGARWVFWFDAFTYLVSAALIVSVAIPRQPALATRISLRTFLHEIGHGTRAILREPSLRQAITLSFVEALAGAAAIVATVAYVKNVLARGDGAVAVAMAAVGFGSSAASLALGRWTGRYETGAQEAATLHGRRHRWSRIALGVGGVCLGLALLPGALSPSFGVLLCLWALNGTGQAFIAIASSTLLAEHTFEEERGRVYAAHFALTHACWLITYPIIGHAAARVGTPMTFSVAGALCLLTTAMAFLSKPAQEAHVHARTSTKSASRS